jgi:hypothetical protein
MVIFLKALIIKEGYFRTKFFTISHTAIYNVKTEATNVRPIHSNRWREKTELPSLLDLVKFWCIAICSSRLLQKDAPSMRFVILKILLLII